MRRILNAIVAGASLTLISLILVALTQLVRDPVSGIDWGVTTPIALAFGIVGAMLGAWRGDLVLSTSLKHVMLYVLIGVALAVGVGLLSESDLRTPELMVRRSKWLVTVVPLSAIAGAILGLCTWKHKLNRQNPSGAEMRVPKNEG